MSAPLDINRLAKGLVREETRQLVKLTTTDLVNLMGEFLGGKFKLPFMQRAGLRPPQVQKARKELTDFINSIYHRFDVDKLEKPNKKHGIKAVDSSFYWSPLEIGYERDDVGPLDMEGFDPTREGFKERVIQLTYQRYAVSQFLCTVDEMYQRVTFSEHALYRMIDRGLCEDRPLKKLSDEIILWLPWVNAFNLYDIKGGFIPLETGGLCLQSYYTVENPNDPDWLLHDKRRFAVMQGGLYVNHLPITDLAERPLRNGLRQWTDYRVTTYLSHDMLRSERLWAFDAMMDFHVKWQKEMVQLFHMGSGLDMIGETRTFLENEFSDFRMELKKLLFNPRFQAACKTVSLS